MSHLDIDITNPRESQKIAGFTKEERESFGNFLKEGWIDTFRHKYP